MILYLIRHGRTVANEKHLYCGSTDLPLSPEGIKELQRHSAPTARYLTSGMQRTEETLRILFGEQPHRVDARWREMDFGVFEMHSYEQLKESPAYQFWITGDNEAKVAPGGESGQLMQMRVLEAFHEILCSSEDTVILTHGGPIAAIMSYLFPQEGKNRYEWQPAPGCGYEIHTEPSRTYRVFR